MSDSNELNGMRPALCPSENNVDEWKRFALAYLRGALREHCPAVLGAPALFPRSPLEGEGAVVMFPFITDRGTGPEACFVAVGETEPNYYSAAGLSSDEAFSLHVGTRFMLVVGVGRLESETEDAYDALSDVRAIVDRVAPGAAISELEIAAHFAVDQERHAVLRCRVDGRPVYVMGRDAPPGFSTRTELPPQVAYRMHLGEVLRREPDPAHGRPNDE